MAQESKLERATCKAAEELGVISIKLRSASDNGWPDRMFLIPGGKPFFIEFKAPGEKPDKLQLYRHKILRYLSYDIEVHDNKESAVSAIKARLEARTVSARIR